MMPFNFIYHLLAKDQAVGRCDVTEWKHCPGWIGNLRYRTRTTLSS